MVNVMVERATNDMLIGPDWAMNLEICDMLNRDPSQAKDVIRGIKKKLGSKNPKVQLLTLTLSFLHTKLLLETLVKNCGDIVHLHVAEKDVLHELVRIVKKKPDINVKEKILILIDTWQEAFGGPRARYPQYYAVYQELLRAGAVFPQRSDSSAPVFTPPQTQPLSHYPPNVHSSDFPQEAPAEPSSQSQLPTLSATEIQNARGIMDVLSEMLNALEPGNKEGLRQEVIVDLVEQCRSYKKRVVHLVTNTGDEILMCQGLALSDDLDRLLEKHEAIASGAPIRVEQPKTEPARELAHGDSLLVDTGDSSKHADKSSTANAGAQAELPLLALPAPTTTTSSSVKLDPKIDLLSGDDYNSPTAHSNLALVPVGEAQPVSSLSQQNALVLVDFYSESNMTSSSGAQPSYLTGQTQAPNPFNHQHNLSLSQPMQYANGSLQSQQQNPQSSQSMLYANGSAQNPQQNSPMSQPVVYANGSAQNPGVSQYEQSSFAQSVSPDWNSQQQPPSAAYGSQSDSSFPPPPWEAQPAESNTHVAAQYPEMQVNPQVQQTVPYGQQNGIYHPGSLPMGGNQMGNGMYTQPANQPFPSTQYAGMQSQHMLPGQMYPQQMYGYQMQGYGYQYGYGQQQDPRLLQQQMIGLSMTGNNGGMINSSYPTASSASYSSAAKPKKPEDKLFGDLVDISKFKSAKPTAG